MECGEKDKVGEDAHMVKGGQLLIWKREADPNIWRTQVIRETQIMGDIYAVGKAVNIQSGMNECWSVQGMSIAIARLVGFLGIWTL